MAIERRTAGPPVPRGRRRRSWRRPTRPRITTMNFRRHLWPKTKKRTVISGPGAADFIAAPGGLETPESGTKGVAYTREEPLVNANEIVPDVALFCTKCE